MSRFLPHVVVTCVMATVVLLGATNADASTVRPAGAPQKDNPVSGDVNADGASTIYPNLRNVTTRGAVTLKLADNADGGLCVGLSSRDDPHTLFAGPVCWSAGEQSKKTVADDVLAGTQFHVVAYKRGRGNDSHWAGTLRY